jgi:hypothetical protein
MKHQGHLPFATKDRRTEGGLNNFWITISLKLLKEYICLTYLILGKTEKTYSFINLSIPIS